MVDRMHAIIYCYNTKVWHPLLHIELTNKGMDGPNSIQFISIQIAFNIKLYRIIKLI